ncbi:hypothetical protein RB196_35760, partial [Streptomyces sp. PmtA]|uniref:hypothetical protein n=1 Tax=Streptomyces sp. PmtA TaxID=3074275 RepID=UPI0030142FA9
KEHPEWNINQAIVAFRAGPDLSPEWLRFVLRSPYVIGLLTKRLLGSTAGQFNIALSTCRELPIPVPPLEVQESICKSLSSSLDGFAALRQSVTSLVEQASELRGSLLATAFAGELVPRGPERRAGLSPSRSHPCRAQERPHP